MNQVEDIEVILKDLGSGHGPCFQNNYTGRHLKFIKEWLSFSQNQTGKIEQMYIWELIHGWSLIKFIEGQHDIEREEIQYVPEPNQKLTTAEQSQKARTDKAVLSFLSKKEVIINQADDVFWINPTFSEDEVPFINKRHTNITVVLTLSKAEHLFTFLAMLLIRPEIKIITLEIIYQRLKILLDYLKDQQGEKYGPLKIGTVYFLKEGQYFDYGGFLWFPKHCYWFEPAFDLVVSPNRAKESHFLIESPKLSDIKFIYYGWKKGYISQSNYQKYTAKGIEGSFTPTSGLVHEISLIEVPDPKNSRFLDFMAKEFIRQLEDQQKQQIWACCEEMRFTAGQTIMRRGTLSDHVYILFEGTFEWEKKDCLPIKLQKTVQKLQLYGLSQLRQNSSHYGGTLKALTDCFTMRIDNQNVKFLLFDYF